MTPRSARAAAACNAAWLSDLRRLMEDAQARFADLVWCDAAGLDLVFAHKAILYARSPGNFISKFLQGSQGKTHALSSSAASPLSNGDRWSNRGLESPASFLSSSSGRQTVPAHAIPLNVADRAVLASILEYLYTAKGAPEALMTFLFEEQLPAAQEVSAEDRLRSDMLFMWRSKLYADMQLQITSDCHAAPEEDAIFTVHRMILLRAPYFRNLLQSSYADSENRLLTLPSPPFTPAALHFTLGWLYCGTLDFSTRTYDLSTAFAIWRCAAYLQIDLLQEQVEYAIEDMSATNPARAARVYQWTLSPDVNCRALQVATRAAIVDHFGIAWRKEVGMLSQAVQQDLVSSVCSTINSNSAIGSLRQLLAVRAALQASADPWAQHIMAMLEPIQLRLNQVVGAHVSEVVLSRDFVALLEGRSFSADTLDATLDLVVSTLSESAAARAYEAIVTNVLLREDGLQMDVRARVEDCRRSIVKYLQKRWLSIKDLGGFDGMEPWCLREIADEIGALPSDLVSTGSTVALKNAMAPKPVHVVKAKQQATSTLGRGRPSVNRSMDAPASRLENPFPARPPAPGSIRAVSRASKAPGSPSTVRVRSNSTASSTASRQTARRLAAHNDAPLPLGPRASTSSLRSSAASVAGSIHSGRPKTPMTPSTPTTPRKKPLLTRPAASPVRSVRNDPPSTPRKLPGKLSNASLKTIARRPPVPQSPPGTCLNVGIRCVVSFANGRKAIGDVLYLGAVPQLGTGSFVGLEVDERTELHPDILWTDGVLDGVAYFGETLLEKRRGVFVRPKQVMYLL